MVPLCFRSLRIAQPSCLGRPPSWIMFGVQGSHHSLWVTFLAPIAIQAASQRVAFGSFQASIVTQLCLISLLAIAVAFVHPDHECHTVSFGFVSRLRKDGWLFYSSAIHYPNYGDSVAGSCCLLVGVHSNTEASCALHS